MNKSPIGWYRLEGRTPVPVASIYTGAKLLQDIDTRRVAWDLPFPGVAVSTVFLGLDHSFGDEGVPVLFETLVSGGPLSDEMVRYQTWEQAEAGHAEMLARVKAVGSCGITGEGRKETA